MTSAVSAATNTAFPTTRTAATPSRTQAVITATALPIRVGHETPGTRSKPRPRQHHVSAKVVTPAGGPPSLVSPWTLAPVSTKTSRTPPRPRSSIPARPPRETLRGLQAAASRTHAKARGGSGRKITTDSWTAETRRQQRIGDIPNVPTAAPCDVSWQTSSRSMRLTTSLLGSAAATGGSCGDRQPPMSEAVSTAGRSDCRLGKARTTRRRPSRSSMAALIGSHPRNCRPPLLVDHHWMCLQHATTVKPGCWYGREIQRTGAAVMASIRAWADRPWSFDRGLGAASPGGRPDESDRPACAGLCPGERMPPDLRRGLFSAQGARPST